MSENVIETTETVAPSTAVVLSNELSNMNNGQVAVFSTVKGDDFATKVGVLNAMTNSTAVADHIGKVINLKDVVIQPIEMANERTGELQAVPRITFIDESGAAFHAISDVLYNDVKRIFGLLGMPHTWPAALPIIVERQKGKIGQFFTARVAVNGK